MGLIDVDKKATRDLWESRLGERYQEVRWKSDRHFEETDAHRARHVRVYAPVMLDRFELVGPLIAPHDRGPGAALVTAVANDNRESVDAWLAATLPRVFRRSSRTEEIQRYGGFYQRRRDEGAPHPTALADTFSAMLVSPKVLFRPEPVRGETFVSDEVLETRLAAFLWSSSPVNLPTIERKCSCVHQNADGVGISTSGDKELRSRESGNRTRVGSCRCGALDKAIDQLVNTMIDDPRFDRFGDSFARQWLGLDRVGREVVPVFDMFPEFSSHLARDMRREAALLVAHVFRKDMPLTELFDGQFTFLNERLARHYGRNDIEFDGDEFKLVHVDRNRRGGLIGTGAVMTATSSAVRPSPVQRGMLIASKLLGTNFPPPPPDAGSLPDDAGTTSTRSLREELVEHQRNPSCANCHSRIDPFGFALDGFDFVGRQRTHGPAGLLDTNTVTPDNVELGGFADLKTYLVTQRRDDLIRTLTESVLAYAIGRPIDYRDEATVRSIVTQVADDDYRARSLLRAVATSLPMTQREVEGELVSTK